jgi:hypothetical protein
MNDAAGALAEADHHWIRGAAQRIVASCSDLPHGSTSTLPCATDANRRVRIANDEGALKPRAKSSQPRSRGAAPASS